MQCIWLLCKMQRQGAWTGSLIRQDIIADLIFIVGAALGRDDLELFPLLPALRHWFGEDRRRDEIALTPPCSYVGCVVHLFPL